MATTAAEGAAAARGPGPQARTDTSAEEISRRFEAVQANVRLAYVGRLRTIRLALCCLGAEGHLLVEDHPGLGKTTLAKALAYSLGLTFGRIQFTADLLPSDVTGAVVLDRESGALSFHRGPVFTNVLLADELNRASPKAQSALLESMEERQVSAEGASHLLPRPFMVVATQNPYDAAGTYPLPHSQLDRFLLRLSLGYPDRELEHELVEGAAARPRPEELTPVVSDGFVGAFTAAIDGVHAGESIRSYVLDLVSATRDHPDLAVGASPRASLGLLRAASALAVADGRSYVVPDDVKEMAEPALGHRLVVHTAAAMAGISPYACVDEIVKRVPVPVRADR